MKSSFFIIFFFVLIKFSAAQNSKKHIDYQYHRDDKIYYAYDVSINQNSEEAIIYLTFSSSKTFKNIEKLYLNDGSKEYKLKFKQSDKVIKTDNSELIFSSLILNPSDFKNDKISCTAIIKFKLDDGTVLSLPFNICLVIQSLAKR